MGTIPMFDFTQPQMEERYDEIKRLVVTALVNDGLIDHDKADEWCSNTTFIMKRKGIFRTISDRWRKTDTTKDMWTIMPVYIKP